jgi:hypothetical protein
LFGILWLLTTTQDEKTASDGSVSLAMREDDKEGAEAGKPRLSIPALLAA